MTLIDFAGLTDFCSLYWHRHVTLRKRNPMREVFLSNHLRKEAKKSLVTCLAWVGFALALLAVGIATGVTLVITSGTVAFAVSILVVTRRGPTYATYHCGAQGERILRAHLLSWGLSDEYTAYNVPANGNGRTSDIDCVLSATLDSSSSK